MKTDAVCPNCDTPVPGTGHRIGAPYRSIAIDGDGNRTETSGQRASEQVTCPGCEGRLTRPIGSQTWALMD